MKRLNPLLIVLFAFTLVACSTRPPEPVAQEEMLPPWLEHRDRMRAVETWTLQGRVGARQGSEGANFTVYWQQRDEDYNIRLSGPLGQGGATINGGYGWAELRTKDDHFFAASLEELLSEAIAIDLPLHHLQYWLRGIPSPGARAGIKLNSDALLERMEQHGWTIEYTEYDPETQLPLRFSMRFEDSRAQIIISTWDISGV
ncbi:lipoprotein insertase outer membrane protein LolB [Salinispirillum marinum]|uniref:Outer-membrane lipoprotein LolB n=2 Tax=Saccharospirillaceae TaxID=255527 RepID=A0ABV8BI35_9GAMM